MKYLIYCTKAKPYRIVMNCVDNKGNKSKMCVPCLNPKMAMNGKVVGEFEGTVEEIRHTAYKSRYGSVDAYTTKTLSMPELLKGAHTTEKQLKMYLADTYTKPEYQKGYAIHIKDLKAYNNHEAKELNNYYQLKKCDSCKSGYESSACQYNEDCMIPVPVEKAHQNMMKVYDKEGNEYCLISIKPQWVTQILNGEKTIEIRKCVLKGCLE